MGMPVVIEEVSQLSSRMGMPVVIEEVSQLSSRMGKQLLFSDCGSSHSCHAVGVGAVLMHHCEGGKLL